MELENKAYMLIAELAEFRAAETEYVLSLDKHFSCIWLIQRTHNL